jgi:spoIIIJ-associated protein
MIKTIQKSAKTEDEAVQLALNELGLTRDEVSVAIVERSRTGFLGLKNTPAVVSVSYEAPDEPEPIPTPTVSAEPSAAALSEPITSAAATPKAAPAKPEPAQRDAAEHVKSEAVATEEQSAAAQAFLDGLLRRFGVDARQEVTRGGDTISVNLTALDEPGVLIGRRGETLDAIQHLTNYVVNRGLSTHSRVRVNLDTEGYRRRRGETLEALADKTAARVIKYRRGITLDPMNAYERHVIHTALQERDNISTYSVGSEPNRRVVIAFGKGAERVERADSRPDNRHGGHGRGERTDKIERNQQRYVPSAPPPKFREWK